MLASIFSVNQDIIKVLNNKNVKFFFENFVDIALKAGGGIGKTEKHKLVLEIAIPRLKTCFLLVTFLNSYVIICLYQVQLSKYLT